MRKTALLFILAASVVFISCNHYPKQDKVKLYKQLTQINDTLTFMTKEWHLLLNRAVISKNYSRLSGYRVDIARFLERSRTTVGNMRVYPESAAIIDSEMIFLGNQTAMVSEVYYKFDSYNELTPRETVEANLRLVTDDLPTEIAGSVAMKRSLEAFATRNKLKPAGR